MPYCIDADQYGNYEACLAYPTGGNINVCGVMEVQGDPEGVVDAEPPMMAYDPQGNFYVKTGTGFNSTGWVAV